MFGETSGTSETSGSFGSLKNSCTFAAPTSFKHKRNTQATEDLCPPQPAWLCLRNDVGVILKTSGGHFILRQLSSFLPTGATRLKAF